MLAVCLAPVYIIINCCPFSVEVWSDFIRGLSGGVYLGNTWNWNRIRMVRTSEKDIFSRR